MQVGTDNKIKMNGFYETPKNELVGKQFHGNHKQIFENVEKDFIDYDAQMRKKKFTMSKLNRDLNSLNSLFYKIRASSDALKSK